MTAGATAAPRRVIEISMEATDLIRLEAIARSRTEWACRVQRKHRGTLSRLAGIDLLTGMVRACVENRRRSREFVGFLKKLAATYPTETAIKLILDNHSAHISKETNKWLAAQPEGRFTLVFTPKHGSSPNLVEGFFSKMARSVLRRIRVPSKEELKARILAYLDDLNREPVIHRWTDKIDTAASYESFHGNAGLDRGRSALMPPKAPI